MRYAKKSFYCNKLDQTRNDIKGTWSVINTILHKSKNNMPNYFISDDREIDDPQSIVNEFNNYFDDCCKIALQSMPSAGSPCTSDIDSYLTENFSKSLFLRPIQECELIEICNSFKNSFSYDVNYLNVNIMKQIIDPIVEPLVHIFNISIETGIVPNNLKIAKIVPISKKGDSHLFKNYRPISILPCFSKLLEKCINNRVYSFLCVSSILCNNQYGFRRNHSTTHALIHLQDKIILAISKNNFGIGIFMDLS